MYLNHHSLKRFLKFTPLMSIYKILVAAVPAVRNVFWKATLLGASLLYGKNWDDRAKASTVRWSKNCRIDDLANQWPHTGIRGPTHQPVATPIIAATIISVRKYPERKDLTTHDYTDNEEASDQWYPHPYRDNTNSPK